MTGNRTSNTNAELGTRNLEQRGVTMERPWTRHYDYWVPPHMNYPRRSLYEILRTTAVEAPDKPATSFLGAQLTFGEVKQHVDRFATALARLGIQQGDRVGIMLPNCPQYAIAIFAVLRLGASVVNINPTYTPHEVGAMARDSGIRALLTLDALAPALLPLRAGSSLETIVVTSLAEYAPAATPRAAVPETLRFADLLAGAPDVDLPRIEVDPENDVAVLQYTGGTTGAPKAAMLTHYNIFANVVQASVWMTDSIRRGEHRFLLVIPYFHIYGLTVGLMMGTWMGALQILMPKYDVDAVLAAIRDFRPTYFPAVPTIYVSLLNHPRLKEYRPEGVKIYNSGSAPLPLEIIERFERVTGVTLNEGYGLSEASPVTHSTASLARRKPGSIGLPLPDTDIKIVDLETGTRELPPGEAGELCVAGPQIMKGYWNQPDETAHALRADASGRLWLYTGDVGRLDDEGFTYIVQRKKDMIIVDGLKVYPSEVEGVLYTHPAVMEAAVVGVPHGYHGEVVKACVVLKAGAAATPGELRAHCAQTLASFKTPCEIEIRSSLPKSTVGKVLYRSLRDEVRAAREKQAT
jgi:long-chain acyl-CoA synthetase